MITDRRPRFARLISWGLIASAAAALALIPLPLVRTAPRHVTLRVEAAQFAFAPSELSVNAGDTVTLELVSTDVVHGLYVDQYDLGMEADPGQTSRLTFVADKPGSFRIRCNVACGQYHPFMIGRLTVGTPIAFWRAAGLALLALAAILLGAVRPAREAAA
ncbi:MAG TPA: cupredoxin domain-containing protein [Anaerolineales bacterium]|nr:cupredoxin domain-containing protein [Anaerolineales bacterium]